MIRILSVIAGCLLWWSGVAHAVSIDLTAFKGLERANQVAGEHGQQGRDNAAFHQAIGSPQNESFTTGLRGLPPSTIRGAPLDRPTTVPSSTSQAVPVPEPSLLLQLGLGLVGFWLWRFRKGHVH